MKFAPKKNNFQVPKKFGEYSIPVRIRYGESQMIMACLKWFKYRFPEKIVVKIDNEGKRTARAGALKKAEGLLPGASDLFFPEPMNRIATLDDFTITIKKQKGIEYVSYPGMWLEGKFGKNVLTEKQIQFQLKMQERGYYTGTFYDLDEFIRHCNIYFGTNYE